MFCFLFILFCFFLILISNSRCMYVQFIHYVYITIITIGCM
ncbi:unnamed protein product [Brassica rapa subsp. trilocularis]